MTIQYVKYIFRKQTKARTITNFFRNEERVRNESLSKEEQLIDAPRCVSFRFLRASFYRRNAQALDKRQSPRESHLLFNEPTNAPTATGRFQ